MEFFRLKYRIIFVIVMFFVGAFVSSCSLISSDHILIKLSDRSKCDVKRYSVDMTEMTISFSAKQVTAIRAEHSSSELLLNIPIADGEADTFKYNVHAEYENCAEIFSEDRVVERGWIIYEYIESNKTHYAIRAK